MNRHYVENKSKEYTNEFERTNLLERQREGIALAKKEGKYKGRKKIEYPSNWEEVYNYINKDI